MSDDANCSVIMDIPAPESRAARAWTWTCPLLASTMTVSMKDKVGHDDVDGRAATFIDVADGVGVVVSFGGK